MDVLKEITEILRHLSPSNQAYMMTLVRVAQAAESSAKKTSEGLEQNQAGYNTP